MTGHTYGQESFGVNERAPHERAPADDERAPHEKVLGEDERAPHEKLLDEYERLMNGEKPIQVDIPTEELSDLMAESKIFDDKRFPGKDVGRAPAIVNVEDISDSASSR